MAASTRRIQPDPVWTLDRSMGGRHSRRRYNRPERQVLARPRRHAAYREASSRGASTASRFHDLASRSHRRRPWCVYEALHGYVHSQGLERPKARSSNTSVSRTISTVSRRGLLFRTPRSKAVHRQTPTPNFQLPIVGGRRVAAALGVGLWQLGVESKVTLFGGSGGVS